MKTMTKMTKYSLGIVGTILVLYFSLDIRNLEKYKAAKDPVRFDAADFAAKFWENGLVSSIDEAPQLTDVLKMLNEDPKKALETRGKKLGISKTGYFMVRGKGMIEKVED